MDASTAKIYKIISESTCSKNFECYYNNFAGICRARDMGEGRSVLECLEEESYLCEFSFSLEGSRFCGCKVRASIVQELGI